MILYLYLVQQKTLLENQKNDSFEKIVHMIREHKK